MAKAFQQTWPQQLWIVRHGESAGNIASERAEADGVPLIDIATRDVDVPLSPLGEQQARATSQLIIDECGTAPDAAGFISDERLREKEFGILDRLTELGIVQKYPELGEQHAHIGKFYFRPPGGESWCDVIPSLRSVVDTIVREYRGERVLVVAHPVIVHCFRYLLERMDEQQILLLGRANDVLNCSVTSHEFDAARGKNGKLVLRLVNFVVPLEETGVQVTAGPDLSAPSGP